MSRCCLNDLSGLPLTDIKMSTDQRHLRGVCDQNVSVPASSPAYSQTCMHTWGIRMHQHLSKAFLTIAGRLAVRCIAGILMKEIKFPGGD